MPSTVFMESPAGDVKEVAVTDPARDLVPLMVAGWHQVEMHEPVAHQAPAQAPPPQQAEEEK